MQFVSSLPSGPDGFESCDNIFYHLAGLSTRHFFIHGQTLVHDITISTTDLATQTGNENCTQDLVAPSTCGLVWFMVCLKNLPETYFEEHQTQTVDIHGLAVRKASQGSWVSV
jgi:hypothetical protein